MSIGADYMIEDNILYKYADSGTDFTWTLVDTLTPKVKGYNVEWRVPVSDLASPRTTQSVVFSGSGYAPTAYTNVIILTRVNAH